MTYPSPHAVATDLEGPNYFISVHSVEVESEVHPSLHHREDTEIG